MVESIGGTKESFKFLEVPLSRISETIPYLQCKYDTQKSIVHKLLSEKNVTGLRKEMVTIRRATKQLRDLMYEMNSIKSRVRDEDLTKFDANTSNLCKSIGSLMKGYTDLLKLSQEMLEDEITAIESTNPFEMVEQIQIMEDLDEIKLRETNEKCVRIEALNKDVDGIHEIFEQLNEMVTVQKSDVETVSENTESTLNNVQSGYKHLLVAHKLKGAAYPMTGVVIGSILGGPIGMIAGAKVGTLAAVCCAALGYTGGKILKNVNEGECIDSANEAISLENDKEKKS